MATSGKPSKLQQIRSVVQALFEDRGLEAVPKWSRLRRFTHFWIVVWKHFTRNRCPVRASALAYASLLAVIPMLAVVISITSSLLKDVGEQKIEDFIERMVASLTPPAMLNTNGVATATNSAVEGTSPEEVGAMAGTEQPPATNTLRASTSAVRPKRVLPAFAQEESVVAARKKAAHSIQTYINNTRSGALGITGTVLLIVTAITMLSRIETTFNDIWGVTRGRTWFMRIVLYWGVISLAPVLLIVALGLASGPHVEITRKWLTAMPFVGNLAFRFLPIVLICLTFAAFYILMPNTRVHWRAALVGGLAGGILFHLNSLANVLYVSRVVTNSKMYGGLGLVPVFMIGLYFAWLIVLFGGQVAYTYQNRASYVEEKQADNVNQRGREFVALRLMTSISQRFNTGQPPPTVAQMGAELGVPTRLVITIIRTLVAARLVVETAGSEPAYMPARPLDDMTCHDVLNAMRASQGQDLTTRDEPVRNEVYGEFNRIQEAERTAASSVTMLNLVTRAQARLQAGSAPALAEPPAEPFQNKS